MGTKVVLDDQQGRRVARTHGLAVTGIIGVLSEAWARGLVPARRPELDRLRAAGRAVHGHTAGHLAAHPGVYA